MLLRALLRNYMTHLGLEYGSRLCVSSVHNIFFNFSVWPSFSFFITWQPCKNPIGVKQFVRNWKEWDSTRLMLLLTEQRINQIVFKIVYRKIRDSWSSKYYENLNFELEKIRCTPVRAGIVILGFKTVNTQGQDMADKA